MRKGINKAKSVKTRLLIVCMILLCILIVIGIVEKNIGYEIKYKVITSDKTNTAELIHKIQINEMDCAYDSTTNTWFYPQDINNQGKELYFKIGVFDFANTTTSFIIDKAADRGTYKIDFKEKIKILAYNENSYQETYLQFSGLPIINIQTNGQEIGEKEIVVESKIIDPYYNSRNSEQYIESKANMRLRGGTTKYLSKSQYKYELIKEDYTNRNKELLGMRNDDDWVLDALYVDPSNIRNVVSCEIWNEINSYSTTNDYNFDLNCKFVEVFIDNKYNGIYVLKEPVDAKKVGLNKNEEALVIKSEDTIYDYDSEGNRIEIYENTSKTYSTIFRLEHPKDKDNSPMYYEKISKYFDVDFEPDLEYLQNAFNLNCLIDYNILVCICQARDNLGTKNVYYYMNDTNSKIGLIPWDLDMSWGLEYDANSANPVTGTTYVFNYDDYDKYCTMYFKENADEYNKILYNRYRELRKAVLSYENVENICNNYRKILINSGAYERDNGLYYSYDLNKEIDDILNWYKNRVEYLDNYSY